MDVCNIKDFGAVGDGITDDAQAIQSAINSASPREATVHFPPGIYLVRGPAAIDRRGESSEAASEEGPAT